MKVRNVCCGIRDKELNSEVIEISAAAFRREPEWRGLRVPSEH